MVVGYKRYAFILQITIKSTKIKGNYFVRVNFSCCSCVCRILPLQGSPGQECPSWSPVGGCRAPRECCPYQARWSRVMSLSPLQEDKVISYMKQKNTTLPRRWRKRYTLTLPSPNPTALHQRAPPKNFNLTLQRWGPWGLGLAGFLPPAKSMFLKYSYQSHLQKSTTAMEQTVERLGEDIRKCEHLCNPSSPHPQLRCRNLRCTWCVGKDGVLTTQKWRKMSYLVWAQAECPRTGNSSEMPPPWFWQGLGLQRTVRWPFGSPVAYQQAANSPDCKKTGINIRSCLTVGFCWGCCSRWMCCMYAR